MKFGSIRVRDSEGAILAHSVKAQGITLKKGEVITRRSLDALVAGGVSEVIAAQLEQDDVAENQAALVLAARLSGANMVAERAFTGRCNLLAEADGLLLIDVDAIDRVNDVDEAITVATLPPLQRVSVGELVATVKIIPFAVPKQMLRAVFDQAPPGILVVTPFIGLRVGVISTLLPGLKASTIAKTLDITAWRLAKGRSSVCLDRRVAHDAAALAAVIGEIADRVDLMIVFGASAITDRRDVVPAGIEAAGGRVLQLGMPVDPGNLLLLAELPRRDASVLPVIGAPGCARSAKENGFDHILMRLMAGLPVRPSDLRRMGVGGLLNEIVSRPQAREPAEQMEASGRRSGNPSHRSRIDVAPGAVATRRD